MTNRRSEKIINMDFQSYLGALEKCKVDERALEDFHRKPYDFQKETPSEWLIRKKVKI